jgi:mannose PTS system EIIC component
MIWNVILVSAAGGILCLDRVVLQPMISRPIVAASVIGFLLGEPYIGLIVGAFNELFWIDRIPIGAYIPPNDTIAAILITASSIESAHNLNNFSQGLVILAVLLLLPLGILARQMDLWLCRGNEKLANEALADAARGDTRAVSRRHLNAIVRAYLFPACFIMVTLPMGIALMTWTYPRLTDRMIHGLILAYSLLPLIGTAVALSTINIRGMIPVFCAVFLVVTVFIRFIRDM